MRRLIAVIMLFLPISQLVAQTDRATLTGVVMDPSHSVIPGATVTLEVRKQELIMSQQPMPRRLYLQRLIIGQYTASIAASGFETQQIETFTLEVGETRTLNVNLKMGTVSSEVTVVDAASDLDQTTAEIGGIIHGKQTEALPVNGRLGKSDGAHSRRHQFRNRYPGRDPLFRPIAGGQQFPL